MEIHMGFLQSSGCFSSWLRLPWEIQVNNQMIARMEILNHKGFEVFKPLRPLHEFGLVSLILLGPRRQADLGSNVNPSPGSCETAGKFIWGSGPPTLGENPTPYFTGFLRGPSSSQVPGMPWTDALSQISPPQARWWCSPCSRPKPRALVVF